MVYVDDCRNPYGRMLMSHLGADTQGELDAFADRLGLRRSWKHGDHYDVCQATRKKAIEMGAAPVSRREFVKRLRPPLR